MKRFSKKHIKYLLRKSLKGNEKKYRNKLKRKTKQSNAPISRRPRSYNSKKLYAPSYFLLSEEYCEKSIAYVNQLIFHSRKNKYLEVRLDNVVNIGEGAIAMLLSVIKDLSNKDTQIRGTSPKDIVAKKILEQSGFFNYTYRHNEEAQKESRNSLNSILTKGVYNTPPDEMAKEIRLSMETVWGIKGRNPLLYGAVFEMIRNSCDHAFKSHDIVTWYLSITHLSSSKSVKYSFVDNGKGIIKTLVTSPLKDFINLFKGNADIVETAFLSGIESRTGLSWRGKGLPTIYELETDRVVKNLVVITNNVYLNFDLGIKKTLRNPYSGTYYYWEIDQTCTKYCFE